MVLAVESATACASVALLRGDELLGQSAADDGRHHSETLLPLVDATLREAGLGLDDVAACAVSIGPGAFTSLRIGLATVKGLCFRSMRRVVAVPTLEALAYAGWRAGVVGEDGVALAVLDARRGEVYAGGYHFDASAPAAAPTELRGAGVFDAEGFATAFPGGGCLIGDGAAVIAAELDRLAPSAFELTSGAAIRPDAVSLGLLGLARLAAGEAVDAAALVPRYVRRAEAEVLRTSERFE